MKRQLLLGLGSLLVLSACKAPSVISGSEYNPITTVSTAAPSTPAAVKAAPVLTTPTPAVTAPVVAPTPVAKAPLSPAPATTPAKAAASNPVVAATPPAAPRNAIVGVTNVKDQAPIKVEKIPFQQGVSSYTVERLARKNQCESKDGAGLLTPKGAIEVYRVNCNNGQVFMARCELRQCAPMNNGQ